MDAIDTRLGRYELLRPLGRGGAGEVWEAVLHGPQGFRRRTALKLLTVQDPRAQEALVREARLGALVAHPNVVGTLDLGRIGERWYVAMELVDGASLSALVHHGALPGWAVLELGSQIAAGLAHLHGLVGGEGSLRVLHRDLKPANLLLDRHGQVKIADLGIARLVAEPGGPAGTPGYAAPEQVEGREEPRSDLFSLGVTLLYLASGHRPFPRGAAGLLAVHQVEQRLADPTFLEPADAAVDGLGDVLRRCLRYDPGQRFASAAELGAALRSLRSRYPGGPLQVLLSRVGMSTDTTDARTPDATVLLPPGNLPPSRDRFVGREELVGEVRAALDPGRIVTLHGPGGMGKTRLALEAARRKVVELPGGVWVCDLSEAVGVEGVVAAVGRALGLTLRPGDPVVQVGAALAGRGRALVVLDDVEGRVPETAEVLTRWLAAAPEVAWLATSRRVLKLAAERVVALAPLGPEEAVALVRERSARTLGPEEDEALTELVVRLDGLPLALELAAARLRSLPVAQLVARLDQRFRLLAGVDRDRPERHRSLRAALDGSWEALGATDRRALAQLAVFCSPPTLESVEAMLDLSEAGEPGPWAVDVVSTLVDHALLVVDGDRFRLLESVRAYAREALPGELAGASARHAACFARYGTDDALAGLTGPRSAPAWAARFAETDDLVAAARHVLGVGPEPLLLPLLAACESVLSSRGPFELLLELVGRALAVPGRAPAVEAALLALRGRTAMHLGATDDVARDLSRAHDLAVAAGAAGTLATVVGSLAWFHRARGRVAEAREGYLRQIDLYAAAGRPEQEATASCNLGLLLLDQGLLAEADATYERALPLLRSVGHVRMEGVALGRLGLIRARTRSWEEARPLFDRALRLLRSTGLRDDEATLLGQVGLVLAERGQVAEGRRLLEAALALHRLTGAVQMRAITLGNLGFLAHRTGALDDARARYDEALGLHRTLGAVQSEAIVRTNLAFLELDLDRFAEARALAEEALRQHQRSSNRRFEAIGRALLGQIALETGETERATEWLKQAVERDVQMGDRRLEGLHRLVFAAALRARGRAGDASHQVAQATTLLVDGGPLDRIDLGLALAEHAAATGEPDAALRHLAETERSAAGLGLLPTAGAMRRAARLRTKLTAG